MPSKRLLFAGLLLGLAPALLPAAFANACVEPGPTTPLVQVTDPDGVTSLQGWVRAPTPYSENRIVPRESSAAETRVLTIQSDISTFDAALRAVLQQDGITKVSVSASQALRGVTVDAFRDAAGMRGSAFGAFVAEGEGTSGRVNIVGLVLLTPTGDDAGSAFEMFIAPPEAFEQRGGWVVPAVRYLGLSLNEPDADLSVHGSAEADEAAAQLAGFFEQWMQFITAGKNLAAMGTLQTLGMQNGMDQSQAYGLHDPMYTIGN